MGKKGKRSGFGAAGGGGNGQRRPPAASPGIFVVNPAILQKMGGGGGGGAAKGANVRGKGNQKNGQKPKQQQQNNKKNGKNGKKRGRIDLELEESEEESDDEDDELQPTPAKRQHGAKGDVATELVQLQVEQEGQCLAALYWVLLTRDIKRSAVVMIPNNHPTLTPSLLSHAFKSLGFQALAIHNKMTGGQRKQNVQRLIDQGQMSKKDGSSSDKFVLVTNEHLVGTAACATADLLVLGSSSTPRNSTKFASVYTVHADMAVPAEAVKYAKPLSNPIIQQLQARLKLATQIATILQHLASSGADKPDADTKWASKFAKGADLSDDDDDDVSKKKKLSPEEQRLRALNEKLLVLLARDITSDAASASTTQSSNTSDFQNRVEKLRLLGIITMSAAMGTSVSDGERLSAQTQWLDAAPGVQFGGDWSGAIRHGASKDKTSLVVRKRVCECIGVSKNFQKKKATDVHLQQWRPNHQPADVENWGGAYGKVCGHNEVVMQHVRPFFPQEVVNSRVCSKRHPAPGNQGFDGCLEFLRLACMDGKRHMTVWDSEQFIFITKAGRVSCVNKLQFVILPLAGLQTLMANMRQWTIASDGRVSPVLLLEGIRLCARLGTEETKSERLPDAKLVRRVLAFAIGGSSRVWKQISKMLQPIAQEIVYEAQS